MKKERIEQMEAIVKEMEEKRFTPDWLAFGVVCKGCLFDKNIKGGYCSQFYPPRYVFSINPNCCPNMKYEIYFFLSSCKEYYINIEGVSNE